MLLVLLWLTVVLILLLLVVIMPLFIECITEVENFWKWKKKKIGQTKRKKGWMHWRNNCTHKLETGEGRKKNSEIPFTDIRIHNIFQTVSMCSVPRPMPLCSYENIFPTMQKPLKVRGLLLTIIWTDNALWTHRNRPQQHFYIIYFINKNY